MSSQKTVKAEILEWCSATHVVMQIERHNLERHNLAVQYPVIALTLARQNKDSTLLAINAAIDRGDPVDDSIACVVGVSPQSVGCLVDVAPETVTEEWLTCPIELFWAMDVLHPLDCPQTTDEWALLRKLWINTGLEKYKDYRTSAGASRERQKVLEYLFRGLCAQGYGEATQALADRLVALLPDIETDPQRILSFHCYVSFVKDSLSWAILRGRTGAWNGAERLLMRYSPGELIRQWESWRCIVAAHGESQLEVVSRPEDIAKSQWIMRIVVPDFDELVRWFDYAPMNTCSIL